MASHLPGHLLRMLFGFAAVLVATHMLLRREGDQIAVPRLSLALLLPLGLVIGFTASLVGLGGAVFTTIALVSILRYPMRQVVGISTFVQTAGALFGALGYMLNGLGKPGLPHFSIGYVNLLAVAGMVVTGVPLARWGATYTHRINATSLKRVLRGGPARHRHLNDSGGGAQMSQTRCCRCSTPDRWRAWPRRVASRALPRLPATTVKPAREARASWPSRYAWANCGPMCS